MTRFTSLLAAILLWPCLAHAQVPSAYYATLLGQGTPTAMNNKGQVVGIDDAYRATVWRRDGVATLLPGQIYQPHLQGINDDGTVIGYGVLSNPDVGGWYQPVIWRHGGSVERLDLPGPGGITWGINNRGDIVGSIVAPGDWPDSRSGGFVQREGETIFFDNFYPSAINDKGEVIGQGFNGIEVWRDGEFSKVPEACCALETAINNNGWIVGSDSVGSDTYASLWRDGQVVRMWQGYPSDINEAGMVVGVTGYTQAMLWYRGQAYVLDHLWNEPQWASWTLTRAVAINENGEIAAQARNIANGDYAILLLSPAPIPEPAFAAQLLSGLALLGLMRVRRGRRSG